MLQHTIELSSPLLNESFGAFCLCNFIIAILLLLNFGRATAAVRVYEELEPRSKVFAEDVEEDDKPEQPEKPVMLTMDRDEKESNTDVKNYDNGEEVKEGDEELRRRAEEFIQRMVEVWKVEKQMQRSQILIS